MFYNSILVAQYDTICHRMIRDDNRNRLTHNLKVVGSNPTPATNITEQYQSLRPRITRGFLLVRIPCQRHVNVWRVAQKIFNEINATAICPRLKRAKHPDASEGLACPDKRPKPGPVRHCVIENGIFDDGVVAWHYPTQRYEKRHEHTPDAS